MKTEEFAGKVALITGGSRGVGLALARQLAEQGAKVVITARGEARLLDSQKKLSESGAEVRAVAGDVGKWDDARKMVDAALTSFGRLDILVNNAGVSMRGNFAELAPEVCDRVVATNLAGCITLSRLAINPLIESRGSLVFISSIAGLFGLPGASIYCATKKALTGLAESLRIELAGTGVHVGVVYLGFTEHDPEKRILAQDGSLMPPDRPAHHTQAHAAELIIKMLKRRKRQLVMTPAGKAGAIVYRISPLLLEKAAIFAKSSRLGIFKRFS
ncbi:MAG TPA: SDR family oxidoreductase [bacterium]|nr:SDR family oxidoreductase [bacterium]